MGFREGRILGFWFFFLRPDNSALLQGQTCANVDQCMVDV